MDIYFLLAERKHTPHKRDITEPEQRVKNTYFLMKGMFIANATIAI